MASSLSSMRIFSRGPYRAVNNAIREQVSSIPSRTPRAHPVLPVQRTLLQRQHAYAYSCRPIQSSITRSFTTTTPCCAPKSMSQLRARNSTGPFSWKAALLFVVTGGGMIVYFQVEKERLARKRIAEMSKGVGRPKVGGPFVLRDLNGEVVTDEALRGKYSFVYFGFTHCPDICPDELDKMAAIIDKVNDTTKDDSLFLPVFITCDPARDTPDVLRAYLQEFHPKIVGLTGTYDQIKQVCKMYRVYFSTPRDVKPGEDYLVDHSIYFYLMDPDGDFVECIGRQDTPESASKLILEHINDWKRAGKPLKSS